LEDQEFELIGRGPRAWRAGDPVRVAQVVTTLEDGDPPPPGSLRAAMDLPVVLGVVVEDADERATRVQVETIEGERLSVEADRLADVPAAEVEDVLRRLERAGVLRRRPRT
jgi:hypothetical protein